MLALLKALLPRAFTDAEEILSTWSQEVRLLFRSIEGRARGLGLSGQGLGRWEADGDQAMEDDEAGPSRSSTIRATKSAAGSSKKDLCNREAETVLEELSSCGAKARAMEKRTRYSRIGSPPLKVEFSKRTPTRGREGVCRMTGGATGVEGGPAVSPQKEETTSGQDHRHKHTRTKVHRLFVSCTDRFVDKCTRVQKPAHSS